MSDELLSMLLEQLAAAPQSEEALAHLAAHFHDVPAEEAIVGVAAIARAQPLEVAARHGCAIGVFLHELHPEQPGPAAADAIAWARTTCERALQELGKLSDADAWNLAFAIAVFDARWTLAALLRDLSGGGQTDAECPLCKRALAFASDGKTPRLLKPNGDSGEEVAGEAPPEVEELARLVALARGYPAVADVIATMNGTAGCPFCKRPCAVWAALTTWRS